MNWQWFVPTKVFYGDDVIKNNASTLKGLGEKAMIVTGQGGSAKRNGSLGDMTEALESMNIKWELFNAIEANPSIDTIHKGAEFAKKHGVDFVIGIGGGSPLDAAKAIAVLAVNDISDEDLFALKFDDVLPIVAVPTTAGTGSEVTPYSIITYPAIRSKKSIFGDKLFPQVSFLDPKYTLDLPLHITIDTAVDAYAHVLEGYLSPRHTLLSDLLAKEALGILGAELRHLAADKPLAYENRNNLLYGSMLAGMVISHTATSIPHALSYSLTYFKDIPHGRANGMVIPEYIKFNLKNSDDPRIMEVIKYSGFEDVDSFIATMRKLSGTVPKLEDSEIEDYINLAYGTKNIRNNVIIPELDDLRTILKMSM
ncbi:MAG: iron-containing alcohol dehydrogenase [Syntrophomonadaceae bacterium]|nr:iron-containing alcohol dehydrogenase [Syntrophomonadaceae bacterium]